MNFIQGFFNGWQDVNKVTSIYWYICFLLFAISMFNWAFFCKKMNNLFAYSKNHHFVIIKKNKSYFLILIISCFLLIPMLGFFIGFFVNAYWLGFLYPKVIVISFFVFLLLFLASSVMLYFFKENLNPLGLLDLEIFNREVAELKQINKTKKYLNSNLKNVKNKKSVRM